MHLDPERVERLLDHQLTAEDEASAREHLRGCVECRARLEQSQRHAERVQALLRLADDPPPPIAARAFAQEARGRAQGARFLQRAATLLVALGIAGIAYAVYAAPGSPVRAWLAAAVHRIAGAPKPAPTPPPSVLPGAGIAVAPGSDFTIQFTLAQHESRADVTLSDGAEVVLRGLPGAASYTSESDRIVIDNRGTPSAFSIAIPRTASRVEIRVAGDRIFLKDGARVTAEGEADSSGAWHLPLTPR